MGVAAENVPVAVKLTPNRSLLNCDFETYKLSLNPLPKYELELQDDSGKFSLKVEFLRAPSFEFSFFKQNL
jgi:hypothetical protein